ncbi:MAG: aspartate--tRNA ligase, partial [Myxococcota bacterium]|nr:aspartate--tRNA ligase [Myxococcota bacterium]
FYALPQSPQLFKQLLMVAGVDRYMQIVRCFRDEDLRADRQPEFTQIDLEMSFVGEDEVMAVAERLMVALWRECLGVELPAPFPRMAHAEAMARYGSDKPDLRFGMELIDGDGLGEIRFDFVRNAIADGGILRAMVLPGGASRSRKQLDAHTDRAKQLGLGGLLWAKIADDRWTGPGAKGFAEDFQAAVADRTGATAGDLFLAATGESAVVLTAMDRLRRELAAEHDLIPKDTFACAWIVDFPLVEYDEEADRHVAMHHPFTRPLSEDLPLLDSDPGRVRARAYDLVVNGVELGGGSLRIHEPELQDRMFRALGIGEQEAADKFGFLRRALSYGAPPHGGLAFGFDRMVAMLAGTDAIRDVIAFPKTTSASCPMTAAPSAVDPAQLRDLGLTLSKD